jgi:hypothetical protein
VAGAGGGVALPRILNITVPQVGHLPLMALRPFFMVSSTPSAMGFLALHLTQYPSDIKILPPTLHASDGDRGYLQRLAASIPKETPQKMGKSRIMEIMNIFYTNLPPTVSMG